MSVGVGDLQIALKNYLSPTVVVTVPQGTPVLAGVPLLRTYGSTDSYYTPTNSGRLYLSVALSAAAEITMSRNASASSPIYDALLSSQTLNAQAEYEFDVAVSTSDVIDFQASANVTVNVLKLSFRQGV